MCACIGLPITNLRYTLVPRDDQALKQVISNILDMSVLCTPLNDAEIKKALCDIPRHSNSLYMGVLRGLGECLNEGVMSHTRQDESEDGAQVRGEIS